MLWIGAASHRVFELVSACVKPQKDNDDSHIRSFVGSLRSKFVSLLCVRGAGSEGNILNVQLGTHPYQRDKGLEELA